MKKKLLNCLLPLACLATVSVSCGSSAQAAVLGDDYPSSWKYGGFGVDPWTMYWRQCTSFAAYRLSNTNGFTLPVGYGNAITWGSIARANGHRVDMNPAVGSIAWFSAGVNGAGHMGHVAWVAEVHGDQVTIEEYNYDYTETYHRRIVKASSMTGFIHFKDVGNASVGPHQSLLAFSGTHHFTEKSAIMDQPSLTSTVIDYYEAGMSVHYDQTFEKEGYKWISYISRSGNRRYIPLTKTSSSKNGWEKEGTSWYYYDNGQKAVGWKKINGNWYHLQADGRMTTGWLKEGSNWYYLKSSGEMQIGWLKDKGIWYYLESSGAMKTSQWFQVSGKHYYVNASGELAINTTIDGFQVDGDGVRVENPAS